MQKNRKKTYSKPGIVYKKRLEVLSAVCNSNRSGWTPNCMKVDPCTKTRT